MNSKYRSDSAIELYVNAEELHAIAEAATKWFTNELYFRGPLPPTVQEVVNHLQSLSMKLRANEALNSLEEWKP